MDYFPLFPDNIPPLLSWQRKPPAVSGKRIKLRWKSNEKADFFHIKMAQESVSEGERRVQGRVIDAEGEIGA